MDKTNSPLTYEIIKASPHPPPPFEVSASPHQTQLTKIYKFISEFRKYRLEKKVSVVTACHLYLGFRLRNQLVRMFASDVNILRVINHIDLTFSLTP